MKNSPKLQKLVLLHILFLTVLALLVFKYSEELLLLKRRFYASIDYQPASLVESVDFSRYKPITYPEDAWFADPPMIYHGAGGIDGLAYTNSQEALEQTISNGNRYIEIDFLFTSDGELVCAHEWRQYFPDYDGETPTLQAFLKSKVFGKYTPMTAKQLISYMREYPDLHIIIDTKEEDAVSVIRKLKEDCGERADILKNFIIQVYDGEMKAAVKGVYPFEDTQFLFTAYKYGVLQPSDILDICCRDNISVVTVPYGVWDQEIIRGFGEKGFIIYEHTVNRLDCAQRSAALGVHSFYTDFLPSAAGSEVS